MNKLKKILLFLFILPLPFLFWQNCKKEKKKNSVSESKKNHLYIYATFGSLPSLYANLHIYTHQYPSLVYFERDSYDIQNFPSYVALDPESGKGNFWDKQEAMHLRMQKKIKTVFEENPETIFHLYVDDLRLYILKLWLWDNGIPDEQIQTTLLSDGTGSYILLKNRYSVGGLSLWNQDKTEFERLKLENTTRLFERDKWTYLMHVAAYQENIRYWLQFPEYLDSQSAEIQTEIDQIKNIIKIDPVDLWNKLSITEQSKYKKMARFTEKDEAYYHTIFAADGKPNLIVAGTNPSSDITKKGIELVLNKYGDKYNYFFKPHPADSKAVEILNQFPQLKKLEGTVPMELLFWFYEKNISIIGGHESTLYLSVPKGKAQFFFTPKLSVPPLDVMWEKGYFNEATLLNN